jgi:hypothetical protein
MLRNGISCGVSATYNGDIRHCMLLGLTVDVTNLLHVTYKLTSLHTNVSGMGSGKVWVTMDSHKQLQFQLTVNMQSNQLLVMKLPDVYYINKTCVI